MHVTCLAKTLNYMRKVKDHAKGPLGFLIFSVNHMDHLKQTNKGTSKLFGKEESKKQNNKCS